MSFNSFFCSGVTAAIAMVTTRTATNEQQLTRMIGTICRMELIPTKSARIGIASARTRFMAEEYTPQL